MKKILIVLALIAPCSAFAGVIFHPVERAAVVANSDHPVAAATVTAQARNHRAARVDAVNCNDGRCVQHGNVVR
ncbi:hypothetical protein N7563_10735 [Leclercia adecarboxylata ATCC 23216 = NBRC 102595]|jgi:hypothetical protein|nr:hypothetical protein [Leclercia adecarboxylata ATCC 23216 = NBRC 102595]